MEKEKNETYIELEKLIIYYTNIILNLKIDNNNKELNLKGEKNVISLLQNDIFELKEALAKIDDIIIENSENIPREIFDEISKYTNRLYIPIDHTKF